MKDTDIIYMFASFSGYDNDGDAFVKKYKNDPNSIIVCWGVDDDPWPDGTYHDIMGGPALGHCQYTITTTYSNLKDKGWLDDLIYQCEYTEYHKNLTKMNNYDEIAIEAIKNIIGRSELNSNSYIYKIAYEAAKLQAERFNKDLDDSYIESLSKEELS